MVCRKIRGSIDPRILPINSRNAHTLKTTRQEVLCLHEVETLLRYFSDEDFAQVNFTSTKTHMETPQFVRSACLFYFCMGWFSPRPPPSGPG